MPLYSPGQMSTKAGSRSNNQLEKTGHQAPYAPWLIDTTLPVLFNYPYGGPGQKNVVIAKGHLVSLKAATAVDFADKKSKAVVTLSDGTLNPIGMAAFNVAQKLNDRPKRTRQEDLAGAFDLPEKVQEGLIPFCS